MPVVIDIVNFFLFSLFLLILLSFILTFSLDIFFGPIVVLLLIFFSSFFGRKAEVVKLNFFFVLVLLLFLFKLLLLLYFNSFKPIFADFNPILDGLLFKLFLFE